MILEATVAAPILKATIEEIIYKSRQGEIYPQYRLCVFQQGKSPIEHQQDTLEIAMEQAEEEYHIPRNSWKKVEA